MAEKDMVNVGCRIPSGLVLHVMKRIDRPKAMDAAAIPMEDMGLVTLSSFRPPHDASYTPVEKTVWDVWYAENKTGPLVTGGSVFVPDPPKEVKPEPKPVDLPKPAPAPAPPLP